MNLNVDCILTVFDYLELSDMLSLAQVNENLVSVIGAALERRFATKQVFLETDSSRNYRNFKVIENEYQITFHDSKGLEFSKFLPKFGHLIPKLYINGEANVHKLFEKINFYCSESLTELTFLVVFANNINDAFKKSFKNLQYLRIRHSFNMMNHSLTFTDMFPAMESLVF